MTSVSSSIYKKACLWFQLWKREAKVVGLENDSHV